MSRSGPCVPLGGNVGLPDELATEHCRLWANHGECGSYSGQKSASGKLQHRSAVLSQLSSTLQERFAFSRSKIRSILAGRGRGPAAGLASRNLAGKVGRALWIGPSAAGLSGDRADAPAERRQDCALPAFHCRFLVT